MEISFISPWYDEEVTKKITIGELYVDSKDGCSHIMREYVGATEAYNYCLFCDKKEPTNVKD